MNSRLPAIMEGLTATLIWSSSFVFSKIGLAYLGPFTIVSLQYIIAFLVLLPLIIRQWNQVQRLPSHIWKRLLVIGLCAYTVGNGTLIWGLQYIPAATGALLLSFSPLLVLLASVVWLKEVPGHWQVVGVFIVFVGSILFFSPGVESGEPLGILIVSFGLVGFVLFSILGREIAGTEQTNTILLTAFPFAFGGGVLLVIAVILEGPPPLSIPGWGIILWLAIIDTAVAYALYNHSLRILTAIEMNVMLALSPLGTAILGWFLLKESLNLIEVIGILIVIFGVFLVQQYSGMWKESDWL